MSDYLTYRGKCKEMCEDAIKSDSSLVLVRGHYECPYWGMQPHWWTERPDGSVFDPTKNQFPSQGDGAYHPFDGIVSCAECGKEMKEDDASYDGRYAFCSYECHGSFVGVM